MNVSFSIMSTHKFIGLADGNIISWCPTLNLLTISMNKMALWVYRLNGERIYSVNNKSPIRSISFINNGKCFCLSGLDNLIKIYDSNTGQMIKVIGQNFNEIKLINWSYHNFTTDKQTELFDVNILSSLPKLSINGHELNALSANEIRGLDNDLLNYLIIADLKTISINFNNLFTVTDIEYLNLDIEYISHFNNNNLFNQFFLIKNDDGLKLIELSMNRFSNFSDQKYLIRIILIICKVISLSDYINEQMLYLMSEIGPFLQLYDRYLSNLNDLISSDLGKAADIRIKNCLYDMIITNLIPDFLKDYWLNQLGERGLKKLSKQGTAVYEIIRKNVFSQLIVSYEKILVLLSELESLCIWFEDSDSPLNFGLNRAKLMEVIDSSKKSLTLYYNLIWDINKEQKLFNKFLSWLKEEVIDKISKSDDISTYLAQLKLYFHKNSELIEYVSNFLLESKIGLYFNLNLSSNEVILQKDCPNDISLSYRNFRDQIDANLMFPVKDFINSISKFKDPIELYTDFSKLIKTNSLDEKHGIFSTVNALGLILVKFAYSHPEKLIRFTLRLPENLDIIDYQFTNSHDIVLLTSSDESIYNLELISFHDYLEESTETSYEMMPKLKSKVIDTLKNPRYLAISDTVGCVLDSDRRNHIIFEL
ncbi:uncharacterized protein PRCAT00002428001 [Priceomyces carsonii]|uniref:uncharacterized protein n=1 Tax=Priceomyces carsonii TaxID=28549 RepID=UPI002ED80293|nr:unnamed protein product [Priceomyces carsonii]